MKRLVLVAAAAVVVAVLCITSIRQQQATAQRRAAGQAQRERDRFVDWALAQRVAFTSGELTLQEFAQELAQQGGFPVTIDEAAILNERPTNETLRRKYEVQTGTITVRAALDSYLDDSLWADFRPGEMVITTSDQSVDLSQPRTVVYPLPQPEPGGIVEDDWADLLSANIRGLPWNARLRSPHIESVPGALVVVHSDAGHHHIRWLIERLSQVAANEEQAIVWPPSSPAAESTIWQALDQPAMCEVAEMPFADVLRHPVVVVRQPCCFATPRTLESDEPDACYLPGGPTKTSPSFTR